MIPEYLRLGSWDLLKVWTRGDDKALSPRLALQMVNEGALCVSGVRPARSVAHQGFELLNGLPFLATDKEIHTLLDEHTIEDAKRLQIALATLRLTRGDYTENGLLAFDPHRLLSYSRRIMPMKKKSRGSKSEKILQTFFCMDAPSGQPIVFTIGYSSSTTSNATMELLEMLNTILPYNAISMADSEHATASILTAFLKNEKFDVIMPMSLIDKIKHIMPTLHYERKWAGYCIGETDYRMQGVDVPLRLVVQRSGEVESNYHYKPFVMTGNHDALKLLNEDYPKRWTVEEFFNFEAAMGWKRASTMNLNIRYGKMTLALIAQAATYSLRQKLPPPYTTWTAEHLANSIFRGIKGDLRVKDDKIVVTYYGFPENLNIRNYYENLPVQLITEGVDPRIPWLYNFKIDFKFK